MQYCIINVLNPTNIFDTAKNSHKTYLSLLDFDYPHFCAYFCIFTYCFTFVFTIILTFCVKIMRVKIA